MHNGPWMSWSTASDVRFLKVALASFAHALHPVSQLIRIISVDSKNIALAAEWSEFG